MGYKVNVIPRREKEKPIELDEALKVGCDDAAKYGTKIYVHGKPRCGKTTALKYFISKASEYFGVDESEILYMESRVFQNGIAEVLHGYDDIENFRKPFTDAKMIVIDDIEFIKEGFLGEQEFLSILEMDKIIIVSASKAEGWTEVSAKIENETKYFTQMEIDQIDEKEEYLTSSEQSRTYDFEPLMKGYLGRSE